MLLRFQFSNFRSFRTAQDLVLVNRDENDPANPSTGVHRLVRQIRALC